MATFLAIYSKDNKLKANELEPLINDFSLKGSRAIIKKEYTGLLLCFAVQFENSFFETNDSLSFVSGHISFDELKQADRGGTTVQQFDSVMNKNEQALVSQLEGAFAALHYNKKEHTLTIVNDKFGCFPLFISENSTCIAFSNEYQPLMQLFPQKNRKLNYNAIAEFFTLGITLGNKTFFKDITNLPAASYLRINGSKQQLSKYWKVVPAPDNKSNPDLFAEELLKTFTLVNREYFDAGVFEMCLLSAGADSRLIVATLTEEQRRRMDFYTSNLSFLLPEEDKDVIGASLLAKKLGLKHKVEKISFYENQFNTTYFDTERKLREKHIYGGWHGGELLGGYCLNAAPIRNTLSFKEVDQKLKSIFSWRFRLRLNKHPYKTYLKEKEAVGSTELAFMIEQLTRGFFTNIYGGTRGHWVQPYQLSNHGFSPFWDSRFLQKLMHIPLETLKDYNLYNKLFALCEKQITEIPSNSPLTNRADTVIPKLEMGIEPKGQVPNTHHKAYLEQLADKAIWQRNFYNEKKIQPVLDNEFDALTRQWLDFEVWYKKYVGKWTEHSGLF